MPDLVRSLGLSAALLLGVAGLGLSSAGLSALPPKAQELLGAAREDLARGDGIATEMRLRKALSAGALREDVAAGMGRAFLLQGNRKKAREWLGAGQFAAADAAQGFRSLAALERDEGNLASAGRAFDKALRLAPQDAGLWVEVGRLRYVGGEHLLAIEAADYALKLEPQGVRPLEFKGQIVRDQFGLAAALPWFEAALEQNPRDPSVLGEYAATLGEIGRASDMLRVTGQMLAQDDANPRALYLRAVMAARAGDDSLARLLLNKAGRRLDTVPGALLLDGVLNLRTENPVLAIKALKQLAARQPANARARMLFARALYSDGDYRGVVLLYAGEAGNSDASPYLLTLVGRSFEALGDRATAALFLDRAANPPRAPLSAISQGSQIGGLIASRRFAEAENRAEQLRQSNPGSAVNQAQAGDVQLALGRNGAALERYRLASRVRMTGPLLGRAYVAAMSSGQGAAASFLVDQYLTQTPSSRIAQRLASGSAAAQGDWQRARGLLEYLRYQTADNDPRLLAELAMAQARGGQSKDAVETARQAYRLQPASTATTLAYAFALAKSGEEKPMAAALLTKGRRLAGENPVTKEVARLLR